MASSRGLTSLNIFIRMQPDQRVEKAVISPSLRDRHESTSQCLPQVALYQAGHRKVRKEAVHITK